MSKYSLSHLSDGALLRDLTSLVARDRATTAELLAHVAEVDARKLYRPDAYPSMYAWCVGKLGMCEQAAFKRIRAARAARRFPQIFRALAEGQLHVTAVVMLSSHLTEENAAELLEGCRHKTASEVELLLARRFPRSDVPTRLEPLSPPPTVDTVQLSSRTVEEPPPPAESFGPPMALQLSSRTVESPASVPIGVPVARPRVTPLAPERFGLQVTIDQTTHDLLRRAQELLGHQIPSSNVADVLKAVLQLAVPELERRKFGGTDRPRPGRGRSSNARYIPLEVKRAVWARDQRQCTFVSESGHRCPAREDLEFDHVEAFARGGKTTVGNLRLRCHAHNQFEAERTFGAQFIKHKRETAQHAASRAAMG